MKRLLILILSVVSLLTLAAKKQNTGPSRLQKTEAARVLYDTIVPARGDIRCSGYDKPNRATRETFFITNNSADTLAAVNLTIDYHDMHGRRLHSSTHTVSVDLLPGATLNVGVPSWDRNNAFHYHRSAKPKKRASTPYDVKSRINYVLRLHSQP